MIRSEIVSKGRRKGKELLNGKDPGDLTDEEYEIFADAIIDYLDTIGATSSERDDVAYFLNDVPR